MKPLTIIFLAAAFVVCARAASLADIVVIDSEDEEDKREKRALGFIAEKIGNKFASKFGYHEGPHLPPPPQHELEYGPPITYHSKHFDIWAFKKAIFSALFQAVKAIKGGIIAFKGQLLKAKGHILATKGNILQAKGEAISNFGRELASKSLLGPELVYGHPVESEIPIGPTGYAASTTNEKEAPPPPLPTKSTQPEYKPPEPTYDAPGPASNNYGLFKEEAQPPAKGFGQNGLPGGIHAGLLVLKPFNVPSTGNGGGGGGGGGHFAEPPGSYISPQIGGGQHYNGYAGPLSPTAYDSFGGHPDLSASYSQSAVQSKEKRASPAPIVPTQPHYQQRPQIYYQNPNYRYRQ